MEYMLKIWANDTIMSWVYGLGSILWVWVVFAVVAWSNILMSVFVFPFFFTAIIIFIVLVKGWGDRKGIRW